MNTIERLEKLLEECQAFERDMRVAKGAFYLEGRITTPVAFPSPVHLAVEIASTLPALIAVAKAAEDASKLCWGAINQATIKQTVEGQPFSAATCHAAQTLDAALATLKEQGNG